jgi:aryl-alcohol dehydrogenase
MTRTATAAVVHEVEGPFTLETIELDDLHAGEAYVKIKAVGACHTDLNMQMVLGMPAVVGHEGAGIVEEVAPGVDYVKPGDRVMISWPTCGTCPQCLVGRIDLCERQFPLNFGGRRADGTQTLKLHGEWIHGAYFQQSSFATYSIAPVSSLVRVDDDEVPTEVLAALPCGVMTGAGAVINSLGVGVKDDLVVFGAGAVGLSAVMAGKLVGAHPLVAVDINKQRLELALELGASHVFDARDEDVAPKLRELRPAGFRYAVDTSGKQSSISAAIKCLGTGGVFGVLAVPEPERPDFHHAFELFPRGLRMQFVLAGSSTPRLFLPQLIEWYRQGRFPIDRIVKKFEFAQINEAFASSQEGHAVKPVLMMP